MNTNHPVFVSVETSAYWGAKLLAFLLGGHPEIATVGEMYVLMPREDPDRFLCSCGWKMEATVPHHIVGNRMRLRPISGIKPDERWKSLLAEDQLKKMNQAAGTLGRRYEYC